MLYRNKKPGITFHFKRQRVFDFNERQECIEKVAVGVFRESENQMCSFEVCLRNI